MNNFFPILFRSPDAEPVLGAATPVGLVTAGLQTALGLYQSIKGSADMKKYMAQRKAYQIPDEVYKILNASLNAGQGDSATQTYESNMIGQEGASATDTALKLGADPNAVGAIFGQQIAATGASAQRNHVAMMENFDRVMKAYGSVAENKAAEYKSQQDIVKDKLQAAGSKMQSGLSNVAGGINTGISTLSSAQTAKLYADRTAKMYAAGNNLNTRVLSEIPVSTVPEPKVGGLQGVTDYSGDGLLNNLNL